MSRRKNFNIPGHAHELTFGCFGGYPFLRSERTCQWLADSIESCRREFDFLLWAFIFMPDHVHLIIFPNQIEYDIAAIRRGIKEPVARQAIRFLEEHSSDWLERVTRTRGKRVERHFWQTGGGYDRNIDNPAALWKMLDYIHLNPVRKGLAKLAVEWKWSSAAWYESGNSPIRIDSTGDAWGRT